MMEVASRVLEPPWGQRWLAEVRVGTEPLWGQRWLAEGWSPLVVHTGVVVTGGG